MEPILLLDAAFLPPAPGAVFWGLLVLIILPLLMGGIALVRWLSGEIPAD